MTIVVMERRFITPDFIADALHEANIILPRQSAA